MRSKSQVIGGLCLSSTVSRISFLALPIRALSTSNVVAEDPTATATTSQSTINSHQRLDANTARSPREERKLLRSGVTPIGSRRRRAVLATSSGSRRLAFEQLPYQCFQEARKILQADRQDKIHQIELQRAKIERLQAQDVSGQGEHAQNMKVMRLTSMRKHLEELKVFADINDPLVKKRFEDGEGDLNKPIYRHLAKKKWYSRGRLITLQRITQMAVVPDVLQTIDPTANVSLSFARKSYPPGEFVPSMVSESAPRLAVQVFDKGERFVSVVAVDSDVPNLSTDGFDYRCHFLACNIPLSPTLNTNLNLGKLPEGTDLLLPWIPPTAQKGSPYHRLSLFVLEHKPGQTIDVNKAAEKLGDGKDFVLRAFVDRHGLAPIGVTMFRTQWDEGMDALMHRTGASGAGEELKRKRVEPLPYKWKPSDGKRYR